MNAGPSLCRAEAIKLFKPHLTILSGDAELSLLVTLEDLCKLLRHELLPPDQGPDGF